MDRKWLANDISEIYRKNQKVEAILLGGSVSQGWRDIYSDIELLVFWKEPPTEADRKTAINKADGNIIDFHPYEEEEWSENYITQGIKLEISNFLTDTIWNVINEVMLTFNTDLDKQCLLAKVHNGTPLYGEAAIHRLKEKVSEYPQGLAEAMIQTNIDLGNR